MSKLEGIISASIHVLSNNELHIKNGFHQIYRKVPYDSPRLQLWAHVARVATICKQCLAELHACEQKKTLEVVFDSVYLNAHTVYRSKIMCTSECFQGRVLLLCLY